MAEDWEGRCRRKADQHWDMAGLAARDGDRKDAARHTELARAWELARQTGEAPEES
jgi:hypothetical protein